MIRKWVLQIIVPAFLEALHIVTYPFPSCLSKVDNGCQVTVGSGVVCSASRPARAQKGCCLLPVFPYSPITNSIFWLDSNLSSKRSLADEKFLADDQFCPGHTRLPLVCPDISYFCSLPYPIMDEICVEKMAAPHIHEQLWTEMG